MLFKPLPKLKITSQYSFIFIFLSFKLRECAYVCSKMELNRIHLVSHTHAWAIQIMCIVQRVHVFMLL